MQAGKSTINDIFNQNKVLEIPFFQRAYVWKTDQWERFLDDMEMVSQSNKPYFLGSVILKQIPTSSSQSIGDRRKVIDGQQRLTTMSIFFKVLSLKIKNDYFANIFRLPLSNYEIALKHNHNDEESFNAIMNLTEELDLNGEDQVTGAYQFFKENLDVNKINPQNVLTNVMFVGIDLNHEDDEQQIFDTINSLGLRLTTAELLKNYFFGRDHLQQYKDNWQSVFESSDEVKKYWDKEIVAGRIRRHFIDLFFYSFLQIKIQDSKYAIKSEDKNKYTKVDGLFDSYKSFIHDYKIDKKELIEEIKQYAKLFKANFNIQVLDSELQAESSMDRINAIIFGLENTTIIPYVLYVLKNVPDVTEQKAIFGFLESYLLRRIVCHANTKNYNSLFSENLINNKVLSLKSLKAYIAERSSDNNYLPTDEDLEKGFNDSRLVNKQATGILYFIESKLRTRHHSTAMLGLKSYSLEHIMPKKWENNWPAVSTQQEKEKRNTALATIGNFTIITSSLNSSIRDANWDIKKNGNDKRPGLIKYASGLVTFSSDYLDEEVWDESKIKHRASFLYKKAKVIWNVNEE